MRLLFTLLAVAALAYAVWSAQWTYLREGAERVNRITGRRLDFFGECPACQARAHSSSSST